MTLNCATGNAFTYLPPLLCHRLTVSNDRNIQLSCRICSSSKLGIDRDRQCQEGQLAPFFCTTPNYRSAHQRQFPVYRLMALNHPCIFGIADRRFPYQKSARLPPISSSSIPGGIDSNSYASFSPNLATCFLYSGPVTLALTEVTNWCFLI